MKYYIVYSIVFIIMVLSGCSSTGSLHENKVADSLGTTSEQQSTKKEATQSILKKESTTIGKQLYSAVVIKNIDGDTVKIHVNGHEETVRMLCIDTPETHHPRLGVQPFGPEAAEFTKETLFPGREIQIETGIGGGRDKYGRLLAYIYIDGKMFNEMLLQKGLARVAYVYAPNTKYVDEFYNIQKKAQAAGTGIWSIENYAREDGFHNDFAQGKHIDATPNMNAPSQHLTKENLQNNSSDDIESTSQCRGNIKGNANSLVYHVPGGAYYDSVQAHIVWFCSEQEAQNAGYRKSKR